MSQTHATIQDPAVVPTIPFKPNKRLNILLAMICGFCGSISLAFFFEYLDNTVKKVEDVERLVDWPFLGYIPRISKAAGVTETEKDLLVHIKPKDPIAEAYRTIRTSILFSSTEEHPVKSILITSPSPQEGKTATICNLALTMVQNQKRVLLIDADMRKSRLHYVFDKKNDVGLSSFLSGQAAFEDIIKQTDIKTLSLVASGPHPPNPSELLSSRKIKEFIETAEKNFDFILFDTAPMAVVTDAVILAQAVDGVVVVLESHKTSRKMLPRIAQVLKEARARVIGVLINKISGTDTSYHYYSQYYYGDMK